MSAALDALVIALYVVIDDFLEPRRGPGRPPKVSDSELITLAIAQVFLGVPNDRQFLALARWRLRHLFPRLLDQSQYNRRLRALAPQISRVINYLAFVSPSFHDRLRLLDSTPVPCGQSRETVRRSEFAGHAGYGYCRSHSRWFWGFRLYVICSADGMPMGWELAAANIGERVVAAEIAQRVPLAGHTVIADKGFAGEEFEQLIASCGATFLRPDRRNEPRRHGSLGHVRQWIESTFWTCKGQLGLERHGARTINGLATRIGLRLLALAAGIWHQPPHQPTSPRLRRLRPLNHINHLERVTAIPAANQPTVPDTSYSTPRPGFTWRGRAGSHRSRCCRGQRPSDRRCRRG